MRAVFAQVVGKKAQVALKDSMNLGGRANAVVKAKWDCNLFTRRATPLPVLISNVAIGLRALKPKKNCFGFPFLPPESIFTNDKVIGGMQYSNVPGPSVFQLRRIVECDRWR